MIELKNVTYAYPFQSAPAVQNLELAVAPGTVTLVTGPSGCGKSTLVRLANGLCPHFFEGRLEGEVTLNGAPTTRMSLKEISSRVGTVFQDPELQFFALKVADELAFAHEWRGRDKEEIVEIIHTTARQMDLTHLLESSLTDLSEGQKQKLALGSILSLDPGVVVLDEPSANLDPESTLALARRIKTLKENGIAVLIVDHRLYWLAGIADQVLIMKEGQICRRGDFSILEDEALCRKFGLRKPRVEDVRNQLPPVPDAKKGLDRDPEKEPAHIQVTDLSFAHREGPTLYENASFTLPRGITGLIGDNGTGKTTLARILTGLTPVKTADIRIGGEKCSPKKILKQASIVLQNTDHQLHMNTVLQEVALSAGIHKLTADKEEQMLSFLDRLGLRHLSARHPQSLSGGEKQRLVIACGMVKNPDILILDEPTSGLDQKNMNRIIDMVREAARSGMCILIITHDLELLKETCEYALRLPFSPQPQRNDSKEI